MILADTSAWVEYDRATASPVDERLTMIYRRCRRSGITPRGMIDCMIAAVAWRRGAALLSHDADLDRVAQVIGIEQDEASLRA